MVSLSTQGRTICRGGNNQSWNKQRGSVAEDEEVSAAGLTGTNRSDSPRRLESQGNFSHKAENSDGAVSLKLSELPALH